MWGFYPWPRFDLGCVDRGRDLPQWLWDLAEAVRRFVRLLDSWIATARSVWRPSMCW